MTRKRLSDYMLRKLAREFLISTTGMTCGESGLFALLRAIRDRDDKYLFGGEAGDDC